jgi:hypothetical protein
MNIPPRYILAGVLAFAAFFGYNAWLIQRDNKMFDAYYGKTRLQQYCEQLGNDWHPDCKVE